MEPAVACAKQAKASGIFQREALRKTDALEMCFI